MDASSRVELPAWISSYIGSVSGLGILAGNSIQAAMHSDWKSSFQFDARAEKKYGPEVVLLSDITIEATSRLNSRLYEDPRN